MMDKYINEERPMIKTFINENAAELDADINTFMRTQGRNLALRTECFVQADKVYHKAVVFYDEPLGSSMKERNPGELRIGSLWIQADGTIRGYYDKERITLNDGYVEKLKALKTESLPVYINGCPTLVKRNEFKKSERQPDFLIYDVKEE